jgi:hypothetical protein
METTGKVDDTVQAQPIWKTQQFRRRSIGTDTQGEGHDAALMVTFCTQQAIYSKEVSANG